MKKNVNMIENGFNGRGYREIGKGMRVGREERNKGHRERGLVNETKYRREETETLEKGIDPKGMEEGRKGKRKGPRTPPPPRFFWEFESTVAKSQEEMGWLTARG